MFFSISIVDHQVFLPYGFTLFSNSTCALVNSPHRFTTLWIYTILKHKSFNFVPHLRFHYLMNLHYSQTLCGVFSCVSMFHYLMDLHYSQTFNSAPACGLLFYYLMDLHYCQTSVVSAPSLMCFTTLWIYTILKPVLSPRLPWCVLLPYGFTLFSNYSLTAKSLE